jgi:uncharacterized protein YdeI (YjbR/CyaY-like superfamily)
MEIGEKLYLYRREEWREWLQENFNRKDEIWLVLPKKASGKPKLPYNDSVEEALCFGWIDSIQKTLNETETVQRFSPRKAGSKWSQPNRERLRWLLQHNLVHPSLVRDYQRVVEEEFVFPEDIVRAVKKNKKAWENYEKFSPAYKRIRVAYIEAARERPGAFEKRLNNFIEKTKEGKLIGYGGIEKYS